MREPLRWPREAWIPLAAGVLWLWRAPEHGLVGFLFSIVPGCLLVGSGVSMLLMPGDRRIAQFAAAGGVLGVVFALPAFVAVGLAGGLVLVGASAGAFVAAGVHSVRLAPELDEIPEPVPSLWLAAQVAADEALLAWMLGRVALPSRDEHVRIEREVAQARELFEARGWLEKPAAYHATPPPLARVGLRPARVRGIDYEHLWFESGYEPHPGEPGRERWHSYLANRTAHAWVLRHADARRPWLVCIHGYVMGWPLLDLALFRPERFRDRLGLHLIVPTLPLHGRRAIARQSGEGYLRGDVMDTIHAEAQAIWDLRRVLSWVRAQSDAPIGVFGISLGGYNAALLASLDDALACVIAGVPVADFARIVFHHGPPLHLRDVEALGLVEQRMRELKRVISPLDLEPRVPPDRRWLFAAVADRIVPPDHVRDLWRHWGRPPIAWYQGAHLTFRAHPEVAAFVERALRDSGLVAAS
jgi:dienelactone hydrolase